MSYYPSQGSYSHHGQPAVVYTTSSHHGHHHQPTYATSSEYYGQPVGGMMAPQMVSSVAAPVVMTQGSYGGGHHHHHYHMTFGERLRRFFGLAPRTPYRYKSNRSTWGFMGHSRRPRYVDAQTGGEVDRHGRPIYRV